MFGVRRSCRRFYVLAGRDVPAPREVASILSSTVPGGSRRALFSQLPHPIVGARFVSHRFRNVWCVFLILTTGCFVALQFLDAHEVPLTPTAIHEAYILGQRNDQATADFLSPYIKQPTAGTDHPDIAQIELFTPFAQVVDLSRRNATTGYTEQQAAEDYRRYGDKILVQITLMLPAAYAKATQNNPPENSLAQDEKSASLRPENFWQNFRFGLKQRGKVIATRAIHNKPIYSAPTKDTPSVLDGATVWLEYDAKDLASEETTVEVLPPESKTISATFNLKKLR
jgi:hypothetical protein